MRPGDISNATIVKQLVVHKGLRTFLELRPRTAPSLSILSQQLALLDARSLVRIQIAQSERNIGSCTEKLQLSGLAWNRICHSSRRPYGVSYPWFCSADNLRDFDLFVIDRGLTAREVRLALHAADDFLKVGGWVLLDSVGALNTLLNGGQGTDLELGRECPPHQCSRKPNQWIFSNMAQFGNVLSRGSFTSAQKLRENADMSTLVSRKREQIVTYVVERARSDPDFRDQVLKTFDCTG